MGSLPPRGKTAKHRLPRRSEAQAARGQRGHGAADIGIAIVVEAGDWPEKRKLRAIATKAVKAAVKAAVEVAGKDPLPTGERSAERSGDRVRGTTPSPVAFGDILSPTGRGTASRVPSPSEVSIVFTDDARMRALNARYRGKDRPTNVLSFPQIPEPGSGGPQKAGVLLGVVILSAETVANEARLADKPLEDHMAHLIIHGFLHLLGHDHQGDAEAEKMEQLERLALKSIGISDPYAAAPPR